MYIPEYKNPIYKVRLECPKGRELCVKFDYKHKMRKYILLEVSYDGEQKGMQLAWYTNEIEILTAERFLEKSLSKSIKSITCSI